MNYEIDWSGRCFIAHRGKDPSVWPGIVSICPALGLYPVHPVHPCKFMFSELFRLCVTFPQDEKLIFLRRLQGKIEPVRIQTHFNVS